MNPLLLISIVGFWVVEFCISVEAIKYICKYINKGADRGIFGIKEIDSEDEIKFYQAATYISKIEAVWGNLNFLIHEYYPAVIHLDWKNIAISVCFIRNRRYITSWRQKFHSTFKLPLDLTCMDEPLCNISSGSATAKLLWKAVLIVWDGATMSHRLFLSFFRPMARIFIEKRNNYVPHS